MHSWKVFFRGRKNEEKKLGLLETVWKVSFSPHFCPLPLLPSTSLLLLFYCICCISFLLPHLARFLFVSSSSSFPSSFFSAKKWRDRKKKEKEGQVSCSGEGGTENGLLSLSLFLLDPGNYPKFSSLFFLSPSFCSEAIFDEGKVFLPFRD